VIPGIDSHCGTSDWLRAATCPLRVPRRPSAFAECLSGLHPSRVRMPTLVMAIAAKPRLRTRVSPRALAYLLGARFTACACSGSSRTQSYCAAQKQQRPAHALFPLWESGFGIDCDGQVRARVAGRYGEGHELLAGPQARSEGVCSAPEPRASLSPSPATALECADCGHVVSSGPLRMPLLGGAGVAATGLAGRTTATLGDHGRRGFDIRC
jgi:hypothetical protein